MIKRFVMIASMVLALAPVRAWACGDDGQRACGGDCTWIAKGTCPFCIPWCSRDPYFCHAGNERTTEVALLWTGEVVEVEMCRKTAVPPPVTVTVDQAVAGGCRAQSDVSNIVQSTLPRSDLGTTTRTKLSAFTPAGDWATKAWVTDPDTWGFRAATIPGEEDKLTAGNLTSKALRRVSRLSGPDVTSFWRANGPQIAASQRDSVTLSLQMLATSSSDEPPSQFVSVALDYAVASGFGNIVYRFQLNPQSPVLGLRACQKGGEVQIQPPGGTPIRRLARFDRTKGYWERYEAGVWIRIGKDEL